MLTHLVVCLFKLLSLTQVNIFAKQMSQLADSPKIYTYSLYGDASVTTCYLDLFFV